MSSAIERLVLIVDDDYTILRICELALQAHFPILLARNADDALTILQQKSVHAILSDYLMPGKNGLWVLDQAKSAQPSKRRALMSSGAVPSAPMDLYHAFFAK